MHYFVDVRGFFCHVFSPSGMGTFVEKINGPLGREKPKLPLRCPGSQSSSRASASRSPQFAPRERSSGNQGPPHAVAVQFLLALRGILSTKPAGNFGMGEHVKSSKWGRVSVNNVLFILLRNNRITAEGAVHLSKGLMVNSTLRILKVGGWNERPHSVGSSFEDNLPSFLSSCPSVLCFNTCKQFHRVQRSYFACFVMQTPMYSCVLHVSQHIRFT